MAINLTMPYTYSMRFTSILYHPSMSSTDVVGAILRCLYFILQAQPGSTPNGYECYGLQLLYCVSAPI